MRVAIIGQGRVGTAFKELVARRFDYVTYDPKMDSVYPYADISAADFAVICVPTPMNEDGSCNIEIVEEAISKLDNQHILIKSTVKPGTTDYLSEKYGKRICFSPEYIGQSEYKNSYYKEMIDTPFVIVGGQQEEANYFVDFFELIYGPESVYFTCSSVEAELIKYMENSFFATKVTFVNEYYRIVQQFKADWHKVREGWLLDQRINRTFTSVFSDKKGFNGGCLPKDISAIVSAAAEEGLDARLLRAVIDVNREITDAN